MQLKFINYSNFFNNNIKAHVVLFDKSYKTISLNEYRERIINILSLDIDNVAIPGQIHSNEVKFIDQPDFFKDTDGLIANNSNIVLSLQTADCMPIFLFDRENNTRGLIHSGWKGSKDKIIDNAINIMIDKGSDPSNIFVVIGASIHKCCYEIGGEIIHYFDKDCIHVHNGKFYLSLQKQVVNDLGKFSIPFSNIYIDEECTVTNYNLSSYRRDKNNAGRMISLLGQY